jgi:hypothetical protein
VVDVTAVDRVCPRREMSPDCVGNRVIDLWRRNADDRSSLLLVLAGLSAALAMWTGIVDVRGKISLASALTTVNGPERSVSRESVAAAKRKATAHASITPCCA